jgi:hypothetical protein
MHELYELLQPSGVDFELLPVDSKHICNPLLQVVGCDCAQAPVGNVATSGTPIMVNADASKIFENFDMSPPFEEAAS